MKEIPRERKSYDIHKERKDKGKQSERQRDISYTQTYGERKARVRLIETEK